MPDSLQFHGQNVLNTNTKSEKSIRKARPEQVFTTKTLKWNSNNADVFIKRSKDVKDIKKTNRVLTWL